MPKAEQLARTMERCSPWLVELQVTLSLSLGSSYFREYDTATRSPCKSGKYPILRRVFT